MKANTFRRGSWIVTLPLVAAAVAYFMVFVLPGRRAIGELREQIRVKEEYVDKAAGVATSLASRKQDLEKARAYAAVWQQRTLEDSEITAFYGRIHEAARSAGTRFTRFDPQPPTSYQRLTRIPVTLGCSGSFAQIHDFLWHLEAMPATLWMEALRIEKAAESDKDASCEVVLVIFAGNHDISGYAKLAN
jgi:Tfp pilus assembly protein PilO